MKKGFTLIELLGVVLIIGILAAVALPQYQRAVRKSRMAQWDVMFNTGLKALEYYLLENGKPTKNVLLTGTNRVGAIEMPSNCDITADWCYTAVGGIQVRVLGENGVNGSIEIQGGYKEDGTDGNTSLGNDTPRVRYLHEHAAGNFFYTVTGKAACQWVAEKYPNTPVDSKTACTNAGVTLPNPAVEQ